MPDIINAVLSTDSASKYALSCIQVFPKKEFPKKEIKVPNEEIMFLNLFFKFPFLVILSGGMSALSLRKTFTVFSLRKSTLCGGIIVLKMA